MTAATVEMLGGGCSLCEVLQPSQLLACGHCRRLPLLPAAFIPTVENQPASGCFFSQLSSPPRLLLAAFLPPPALFPKSDRTPDRLCIIPLEGNAAAAGSAAVKTTDLQSVFG